MSINKFLEKTVSFKIIVVIGGFWLLVALIVMFYLFGGIKEGFEAGIAGVGAALDYKMGDGVKKSWENTNALANNNYPAGANNSADIFANLENNTGGPIPLPEGELLFFDTNKFSPECCPATYSNSEGCVCAAPEQMKYLSQRGGNRTLLDEY
jgi:hypothetical protein